MGILTPTTNKQRSDKHEKIVAQRFGGRVTRGSGNSVEKGDVRVHGKFRVECKTTKANSYRLEQEVLLKIISEAHAAGEMGILNVQFETTGKRFVVLSEDDWEEINGA